MRWSTIIRSSTSSSSSYQYDAAVADLSIVNQRMRAALLFEELAMILAVGQLHTVRDEGMTEVRYRWYV